jgi:hypothetical protein
MPASPAAADAARLHARSSLEPRLRDPPSRRGAFHSRSLSLVPPRVVMPRARPWSSWVRPTHELHPLSFDARAFHRPPRARCDSSLRSPPPSSSPSAAPPFAAPRRPNGRNRRRASRRTTHRGPGDRPALRGRPPRPPHLFSSLAPRCSALRGLRPCIPDRRRPQPPSSCRPRSSDARRSEGERYFFASLSFSLPAPFFGVTTSSMSPYSFAAAALMK